MKAIASTVGHPRRERTLLSKWVRPDRYAKPSGLAPTVPSLVTQHTAVLADLHTTAGLSAAVALK